MDFTQRFKRCTRRHVNFGSYQWNSSKASAKKRPLLSVNGRIYDRICIGYDLLAVASAGRFQFSRTRTWLQITPTAKRTWCARDFTRICITWSLVGHTSSLANREASRSPSAQAVPEAAGVSSHSCYIVVVLKWLHVKWKPFATRLAVRSKSVYFVTSQVSMLVVGPETPSCWTVFAVLQL